MSPDLIAQFVNTRAITRADPHAREDLDSAPALDAWWLTTTGMRTRATADDLAAALAVREGLRALLARHNHASVDSDPAAVAALREVAAHLPVRVEVEGRPTLTPDPDTRPAAQALAGLLAATALARAAGTWERLKVCRDPDCREAFVDTSKNRSRTWCSMAVCGTRAKQRTFARRAGKRRVTTVTPE